MERKILAELFVEDDKAIEMDKGTIDYTKDVIDYQCQECGISTGDMRILDEDDPEDAKASDLADKIFNSEENKPTFVYIVKIDATIDGSTDTEMRAFSTREKAKAYFDEHVADEKANNHLMELDNKVVDDYENYFSIYQEGFWSEDRYEIEIIEMELKWNKTCAILKPTIQVKITKEDVLDIICSAVNGGVGYWGATSANDEDYSEAKKHLVEQGEDLKDICYEEVFAQILFDGKSLEITDIENDKKYFLSLEKLFIGLRKAIEEGYYSHYNWYVPEGDGFGEWQLNCCQVDSEVADIIIQFSLFGEVLFG